MDETKKEKKKLFFVLALAFAVLAILLVLIGYLRRNGILFVGDKFGVVPEDSLVAVSYEDLPEDALFITSDRRAYREGDMQLIIPKLELNTSVGKDTTPPDLEERPGLYEFSQLPSRGDVNVSIAGHRDIGHQEFYNLHLMEAGDRMYLVYQNRVYVYEFFNAKIVGPKDWSVISRQGFSALTLTTCDPIGTRLNRLIVVGQLIDLYPYEEGMDFLP